MRLVACDRCHTQYDVSHIATKSFRCRCGETLENRPPAPVDAEIHRCGACGALVESAAESCDYCGSALVRDPGELSLVCPECYARNAEDARFCTACGVAFAPEPVPAEGHELPCPACGGLMPPRAVAGVPVHECPRCHGLWAPGESFELLVARATEARRGASPEELASLRPRVTGANPAKQRVHYRKCPECDGYMQRRNFRRSSGVIIDWCGNHGTWLDADELESIAGFLLSGGTTAASLEPAVESPALPPAAAAVLARARIDSENRRRRAGEGTSLLELLFDLLR